MGNHFIPLPTVFFPQEWWQWWGGSLETDSEMEICRAGRLLGSTLQPTSVKKRKKLAYPEGHNRDLSQLRGSSGASPFGVRGAGL